VTPGKIVLILGLAAAVAILAGVATAFVISKCCGKANDDRWETYRNDFYGYEIEYPADWQIEIGERLEDPDSDFETQGVRITNGTKEEGRGRVLAYVNFQGDWCTTGRSEQAEVTVSGIRGVETRCFWPEDWPCTPEPECRENPYEIVRRFEGARGGYDYTILGSVGSGGGSAEESDTVRSIVETFRFVD
jgi:hypothetical protein